MINYKVIMWFIIPVYTQVIYQALDEGQRKALMYHTFDNKGLDFFKGQTAPFVAYSLLFFESRLYVKPTNTWIRSSNHDNLTTHLLRRT